ncbi:MAG TPA: cupin domain-containing protein [Pararhizobium sp.]|uniref:cupin domain-containing protein n=1 Tax=Pararhizobium sp. TaxID=1977563 RepID=UPI002CE62F74|nr:cupin domain-containing protein [Pararhizobium sp.]HTO34408.1 cupin domain-containing protein [Pararhizobium sp.]
MSKLKHLRPSDAGEPIVDRPGPEKLLEGNPEFRSWPCRDGGKVHTGIWAATPGLHKVERDETGLEQFYILEGEVELTEEGSQPQRFGAGDLVVIEPNFRGTWRTISTVKKVYFFVEF